MSRNHSLLAGSTAISAGLFAALALLSDVAVAAGVLAALLAGATLYFQLTGQRPLAPSPKLSLTLRVVGGPGTKLHAGRVMPAIDVIVAREMRAALDTLPEPPAPRVASMFDIPTVPSFADRMQPSERDRAKFRDDVDEYGKALRRWLLDYPSATWAADSTLRITCEIANTSDVPADTIRVIVRLPESATSGLNRDAMEAPPERPQLRGAFAVVPPTSRFALPIPIEYDPLDRTGGELSLTISSALLHGHSKLSSDVAAIVLPEPGTYEVKWTAWASNLPRPVSGQASVTLDAPAHHIAVESLAELSHADA